MKTQKPTYVVRTGRNLQNAGKTPEQVKKLFYTNRSEGLKKTPLVKRIFKNPRIKLAYVAILVIVFSGISFLTGLPFSNKTGTQDAEAFDVPLLSWAVDETLQGINCSILYSNVSVGDQPPAGNFDSDFGLTRYYNPDGDIVPFGRTQGPGSSGVIAGYREVGAWPGMFNPGGGSWSSQARNISSLLTADDNRKERPTSVPYEDDGGFTNVARSGTVLKPIPLGANSTIYEQYRYSLKWTAWNVAQMGGQCGVGALTNSMLTDLANLFFGIYTFFAFLFIEIIGGVLSLDIGQAFVSTIAGVVDNMYRTLFLPYLAPVVILAALWIAWQGIIKKRLSMSIQGLLWMLFATLVSVYYLVQPAGLLTWVFKQTNTVVEYLITVIPKNGANLADSDRCTPDAPEGEVTSNVVTRSLRCTLWVTFYYSFWAQGQFGSDGANAVVTSELIKVNSETSDGSITDKTRYKIGQGATTIPDEKNRVYEGTPIPDLYLEGFYLSRDEVLFPSVERVEGSVVAQMANLWATNASSISNWISGATGFAGILNPVLGFTGKGISGALNFGVNVANGVAESGTTRSQQHADGAVLVNKPYSRWLTLAALSCQGGKEIAEGENAISSCPNVAAWGAFRGENFPEKISVVVFGFLSLAFATVPLLIMAVILLWYEITIVFLWLVAPIFMLIGVNPGFGRKILLNWFEQIASNLIKQFVTAIFIGAFVFFMAVFAVSPIFFLFKVLFITILGAVALFLRAKVVKGASNINFGGSNGSFAKSAARPMRKVGKLAAGAGAYAAGSGAADTLASRKRGASWGGALAAGALGGAKGTTKALFEGKGVGRGSPVRAGARAYSKGKDGHEKAEKERQEQEQEEARKEEAENAAREERERKNEEHQKNESDISKARREEARRHRKERQAKDEWEKQQENVEDIMKQLNAASYSGKSPEEISKMYEDLSKAQAAANSAQEVYNQAKAHREEKTDEIDSLKERRKELEHEKAQLDKDVPVVVQTQQGTQTQSTATHGGLGGDNSEIVSLLEEISGGVNSSNNKMGDLSSTMKDVGSEVRNVNSGLGNVRGSVDRVSSEVRNVNSGLGNVKGSVDKVSSEVRGAASNVDRVSSEVRRVDGSVNEVASETRGVRSSTNNVPSGIRDLKNKINQALDK